MNEVIMIVGMALATFLIRYPVMVLVGKIPLPKRVFAALRYVPPAVLTAIIVPSLLIPTGHSDYFISPKNSYLFAGVISVMIAWRIKNLLLTIVLGMAVFLILRLILGS